jgi:protease-4
LLVVLSLVPMLLAGGCGPVHFTVGVMPGDQRLAVTTVQRARIATGDRIAIIDVSGMILNARRPGLIQQGENPVAFLDEQLEAARGDARVKAIVLRLNTPGGTVTASDAMHRLVKRFRQETGKPVVALMMDVAASGGYYLACASDRIVAYPTTVTGSIGVILQTVTVKPALDRIGIHAEAFTSGANKDAGSPLSTLNDQHRAVLRQLVTDFYARFVAVVREARPAIPAERFAEVTDGRVFSGDQALALGLVDELGDLQDSLRVAARLARIKDAHVVMFHRPLSYVATPYSPSASAPATGTQINVAQLNLPESSEWLSSAAPGFYYLWVPPVPPASLTP